MALSYNACGMVEGPRIGARSWLIPVRRPGGHGLALIVDQLTASVAFTAMIYPSRTSSC